MVRGLDRHLGRFHGNVEELFRLPFDGERMRDYCAALGRAPDHASVRDGVAMVSRLVHASEVYGLSAPA